MKSRIDKLEYSFKINNNGTKYYYKNGLFHRDKDLPAIVWKDGTRIWYKNGKQHRNNNKPSCIFSNGRMSWFEMEY